MTVADRNAAAELDPRTIIRQAWYVAAWSDELGREPLGRVMLGEMIVLFRAEDGSVVALEDRCPHRNLPLSAGRRDGDRLECGYHGLVFDRHGVCVHVPGGAGPGDPIPDWARVRSYPTTERLGWVFVWMGDPERADETLVPDFQIRMLDPDWITHGGTIEAECGYRLILDNLLDLSHLAFVHASTTGNRALAESASIAASVEGDRVQATRWMSDIAPAQSFVEYAGYDGTIDRWQASAFTPPAYIYVNSGSCPAGEGPGPERWFDDQGLWGFVVYHALTPVTARTTRQFWAVSLPAEWVPAGRREVFEKQMRAIPLEDLAVYEGQQRAIDLAGGSGNPGDVDPRGTLEADEALLAMRRIIRRLSG